MKDKGKKALILTLFVFIISIASVGSYFFITGNEKDNSNEEDETVLSAAAVKTKKTLIKDRLDNDKYVYIIDTGDTYEVAYHNVVDDFHAVPDGKTDCTKAFNRALEAAESCSSNNDCGNLVYVPAGKYVISGNINIKAYAGIVGDGPDSTIFIIKNSSGSPVTLQAQSSIRGVSFYYPDQKITNGKVKEYPATIINKQGHAQIENVNFINSYIAMDFTGAVTDSANNSIIFLNNIKGTPLKTGIINDGNLDTIRISNLNFGAEHWHKYDKTDLNSIKKVLKSGDLKSTAIELRRVDWSFLANLDIKDYYRGIYLTDSLKQKNQQPDYLAQKGNQNADNYPRDTEGELFDSRITNCTYPIDIYNSRHFVITSSNLESSGGIGLNIHNIKSGENGIAAHNVLTNYSIYDTTISSTGSGSVYFGGHGALAITNSTITGKIAKQHTDSKLSITGSKLTNTGMDGCNLSTSQSVTYTKPTDYAKMVTTKPNKTTIKTVGIRKDGKDITDDLKKAIASLKDGGIIYIPTGEYKVSKEIKVTKGIEIIGSTPWAHNGALLYEILGGFYNTYQIRSSRIILSGDATITLEGNSKLSTGLDGIEVVSTNAKKFAIVGNGDNIYVRNVSLPGVTNGIKITGNKFLIEHIWGAVRNEGINVNGNDGIIRECHITKNSRLNFQDESTENLYIQNKTFIVKGSNNIVYHDFTFGPNTGFVFDSATDVKAIGIGVDASSTGINIQASSGNIVNALLVSNHKQKNDNYYFYGSNLKSGSKLDIINPILWSGDQGTKSVLRGSSDIRWLGGIYDNYENQALSIDSPKFVLAGLVYNNNNKNYTKVVLLNSVKNAYINGNICSEFNCKLDNKVAKIEKTNPITSCPAPKQPTQVSPQTQKPPTNNSGIGEAASIDKTPVYGWDKLNLSNTTVNSKNATTTICGLGKTYKNFVYSTSKDKEKTVKISNGCATISVTAGTYQYLKYKLTTTKSSTETRTVQNIGKYLIYAQVYNKLLYVGTAVPNNSSNLGGWVGKNTNVSANVKAIGNAAVNNTKKQNNTNFVKMIYRGILGRESDKGGQQTWETFLKKNSRNDMLSRFVESQEAKIIYSSWGYK